MRSIPSLPSLTKPKSQRKEPVRASAPFSAFLFRIAHNVLVDHYRRIGRGVEFNSPEPPEVEDPAAGPERAFDQDALRAKLAAALDELPAPQREVFLLQQEAAGFPH